VRLVRGSLSPRRRSQRAAEVHLFQVGPGSRLYIDDILADTRVLHPACCDHVKPHSRTQHLFEPRIPANVLKLTTVCTAAHSGWQVNTGGTTSMAGTLHSTETAFDNVSVPEKFSPRADYMDGLPAAFADMSDAILLVDDAKLPVHKAILAANSAVFAELFMTATAQQSLSLLEIPLPGDRMWDVYTALKYLYRGCTPCASSSPEIKSTDDAKALVLFAHKYGINTLMNACEHYLVELAQGDMSDDGPEDLCLFTSCDAFASWTELAEMCNMDTLLAHCELSMIKDEDMDLWCNPAMTSGKISRGSLVRMLRASQLFIHRSKEKHVNYNNSHRACKMGAEQGLSHRQYLSIICCSSRALTLDYHVDIATLMQWKREML